MSKIRRNFRLCSLAFPLLLCPAMLLPASAEPAQQMQDENLLQILPDGYVMANQQRKGQIGLSEMIPHGEILSNWTEMLTTQVFFGGGDLPIDGYQALMAKHFGEACDSTKTIPIADGVEHGYKFAFWWQTCHFNDPAKSPEITFFEMINGNDSSYVVQEAFHHDPSKDEVVKWSRYFQTVSVCDSRLADRPCLQVK